MNITWEEPPRDPLAQSGLGAIITCPESVVVRMGYWYYRPFLSQQGCWMQWLLWLLLYPLTPLRPPEISLGKRTFPQWVTFPFNGVFQIFRCRLVSSFSIFETEDMKCWSHPSQACFSLHPALSPSWPCPWMGPIPSKYALTPDIMTYLLVHLHSIRFWAQRLLVPVLPPRVSQNALWHICSILHQLLEFGTDTGVPLYWAQVFHFWFTFRYVYILSWECVLKYKFVFADLGQDSLHASPPLPSQQACQPLVLSPFLPCLESLTWQMYY